MSKTTINEPDKFELASAVNKNSKTGLSSNRRLLVIKRGHLYYYSNVPKCFKGDPKVLENFHELPKCSIQIVNIKKIIDSNSQDFLIQFEAKNMMESEDIRKTLTNQDFNFAPKNIPETITWKFTCDNQFMKQRWVSALQFLKQYYQKEEMAIKKFGEQHYSGKNDDSYSNNSSRGSTKNPWRESVTNRRSLTINEVNGQPKFLLQFSPKNQEKIEINDKDKEVGNQADIKKEEKKQNIEDAFKIHRASKKKATKEEINISQIEEVSEDNSILQTPIKEQSLSFTDQKQFDLNYEVQELQKPKIKQTQSYQFDPIIQLKSEGLEVIEEKQQQSKVSFVSNPIREHVEEQQERESVEQAKQQKQSIYYQSPKRYESKQRTIYDEDSKLKSNISQVQEQDAIKYYKLFGECFEAHTITFEEKLNRQKSLIGLAYRFGEKITRILIDFVEEKEGRLNIVEQSNNMIVLNTQEVFMKLGLVTTQSIIINGKQKIFYNEETIKNLKREFKIYQQLFRILSYQMKRQPKLKLRIPLAVYIEYRGICCFALEQNNSEEPIISPFQEEVWMQEQIFLKKHGYLLDHFNFTTTSSKKFLIARIKVKGRNLMSNQENLKEYLKKLLKMTQQEKHHNLNFNPPIDQTFLKIALQERASTSIESLEKYIKSLQQIKHFQGICPKEEIILALQYCHYLKNLRKTYRSAQGQVDQTHFFNLVFKRDSSMMALLAKSHCNQLPKFTGSFLSFIEYYFGVTLQIDEKYVEQFIQQPLIFKKEIFLSSTIRPISRYYSFQHFQVIQSINKLDFYLEARHSLALRSLNIKKELLHLNIESVSLDQSLEIICNQASLYYLQNDYVSCIKKCKQYQELVCFKKSVKLIPIKILMLKAYAQFSEVDFTRTLRSITDLIEFNYGPNHSTLIQLYCLSSFYYFKLAKTPNTDKKLNLSQVAVQLLKKSQDLCLTYFGPNSKQNLEILLDLSKIHRTIDRTKCTDYLEQAKRIYNSNTQLMNNENLFAILLNQIEMNLNFGLLNKCEQLIFTSSSLFTEKTSLKNIKTFYKLQFEFGFYTEKRSLCESAIEHLWNFDLVDKVDALQYAYKTAIREHSKGNETLLNEEVSGRFQNKQKGILQIEEEKNRHSSLLQMISEAIQSKKKKILSLISYLIDKS